MSCVSTKRKYKSYWSKISSKLIDNISSERGIRSICIFKRLIIYVVSGPALGGDSPRPPKTKIFPYKSCKPWIEWPRREKFSGNSPPPKPDSPMKFFSGAGPVLFYYRTLYPYKWSTCKIETERY